MNSILLDILACPICQSSAFQTKVLVGSLGDIEEGFIWCGNGHWFPIEERVLEFLPPDMQYREQRRCFQEKHVEALRACNTLQVDGDLDAGESRDELDLIQRQQKHFDWYAENDTQAYDSYAAMPFWRLVDTRTFEGWNAKIQSGLSGGGGAKLLLDVGCAQGRSALMAAQPGVRIIGFDISKCLVRQAYSNFVRTFGPEPDHDFIVADGSRFPFRAGVFDYVLVYGVLHHLPDPRAACQEIVRVLKSRGTYFGSENNRTIFRKIFDLIQWLIPAWHEEAGTQPLIGPRDFLAWFKNTDLTVRMSTIVFVPPHMINMLGMRAGSVALAGADGVFGHLPLLKNQGGLILVEGTKT